MTIPDNERSTGIRADWQAVIVSVFKSFPSGREDRKNTEPNEIIAKFNKVYK